jgi:hypothetical protein
MQRTPSQHFFILYQVIPPMAPIPISAHDHHLFVRRPILIQTKAIGLPWVVKHIGVEERLESCRTADSETKTKSSSSAESIDGAKD